MTNTPMIRAEHLCFTYPNAGHAEQVPAIRDLTVSIPAGQYVAVLGHNGSGKSTFAKLINGILTPTSGTLTVAGATLTDPAFDDDALYELRRRVGMVFQNPDNQMVATLVEEDVAFGPENLGLPREEIRRRVDDALNTVGMRTYANHALHRLSGGQKQRVAIAGVLAMLPDCIVLDEATAMLDPAGRRDVIRTVERLNRERGITVLHITHYMEEAARADRVLVINDGTLYRDGTPRDVFSESDALRRVGLDVPQGVELMDELRRSGIAVAGHPLGAEECAEALYVAIRQRLGGSARE